MRQSDIFTITIVASVGMLATFLIGNAIFGDPNMESASFKTVHEVSTRIEEPDPELFNREAINPTVEVEVGVCEDTNGNGMLDQDEREKCLGIEVQETTTETDAGKKTTVETTTETEEVVKDGITD